MPCKTEVLERYLDLLRTMSADPAAFAQVLHPDMQQTEFPNLLNRKGQRSDLADLLRRAAQGKGLLAWQKYDVKKVLEDGESMAVELDWSAEIAIDAGPFKKGARMSAFFCVVLEFAEGRIIRQRNYDCFEPFEA